MKDSRQERALADFVRAAVRTLLASLVLFFAVPFAVALLPLPDGWATVITVVAWSLSPLPLLVLSARWFLAGRGSPSVRGGLVGAAIGAAPIAFVLWWILRSRR